MNAKRAVSSPFPLPDHRSEKRPIRVGSESTILIIVQQSATVAQLAAYIQIILIFLSELIEELKEEIQTENIQDVLAIANDLTNNMQKISYHGGRASSIVKGMLEHSRTSLGDK